MARLQAGYKDSALIIIPTEKRFDWRHKPVALLSLVILNLLVFFFYQAADQDRYQHSLDLYVQHNLHSLEWPLYAPYLAARGDADPDLLALAKGPAPEPLVVADGLLSDDGFFQYLMHEMYASQPSAVARDWQAAREQVNAALRQDSALRFGLIPDALSPVTLLTYQFLHGDEMHLLGNLFFLLVCGFAVEAAIGHWRFLAFYLTGGLVAGLAHALLDLDSRIPLVGASGAVSAVMAMYLGVFRLRKIEFFYWIFVFVGYFRAPALFILPLYIGKELVDFFANPDSNVAFMAHAGGFAAGAALMAINLKLHPQSFNRDYVEADQTIDPLQQSLADIFKSLENFQFEAALKKISTAIGQHGNRYRLAQLRYQICQVYGAEPERKAAARLLAAIAEDTLQLDQQANLIKSHSNALPLLKANEILLLLTQLCEHGKLQAAESLFTGVRSRLDGKDLQLLAMKLAQGFHQAGKTVKAKSFEQLARGTA